MACSFASRESTWGTAAAVCFATLQPALLERHFKELFDHGPGWLVRQHGTSMLDIPENFLAAINRTLGIVFNFLRLEGHRRLIAVLRERQPATQDHQQYNHR